MRNNLQVMGACTRLHAARIALMMGIMLAFCWLPSQMNAQTLSSVTGIVTDASGGVVPDAKVTITNDATNVAKTVATNSAGSYTVTDLIPGTYTVKVENAGFQTAVHNGIGVEVG